MAKRLRTRRLSMYLFTSPQRIDESLWRQDVELMSLVEEAQDLENLMRQMRARQHQVHVPQWGQVTEKALTSRLWAIMKMAEEDHRYSALRKHLRRLRRSAHGAL